MTRSQSLRGVTLVEVLIVILVLAVLVSMMLPSLSGSRKALLPQCVNNQRQIGIAASMYAEDSQRVFPNLDNLPGNDGPATFALIAKYLKRQTNIFMCPFVVRQRENDRPWYRSRFVPELSSAFFRSNGNDYAYYDGLQSGRPAEFTNAILADRFAWTNRSSTNVGYLFHVRGRINAAYSDGHAESLRPDKVIGADYSPPWSSVQDPLWRP